MNRFRKLALAGGIVVGLTKLWLQFHPTDRMITKQVKEWGRLWDAREAALSASFAQREAAPPSTA